MQYDGPTALSHRIAMVTPAVEIWKFSDPIAVPDGMVVIDQDVISLGNSPFSAERIMIRLESVIVLYHQTSHRLKTHTRIDPELMAFIAIGPRSRGTIDGLSMRPQQLIAVKPGGEANMVVGAGYSSFTLLVPPRDFVTQFSARRPEKMFEGPKGIDVNAASGPQVAAFYKLGRKMIRTAARRPKVFDDSRAARVAGHDELLEQLLLTLGSKIPAGPKSEMREQTRANYSRIIQAAEKYTLSHIEDRILVSDLCRATDVSERTLQLAFQDIMRITPVAYLSRVRLHRARVDLLAATPATSTVSAVAMDWGFWHFGEFSKAYKSCFHEMPSQTLRRK
jgi:AraC family ethanolamine operon transcriptional activator